MLGHRTENGWILVEKPGDGGRRVKGYVPESYLKAVPSTSGANGGTADATSKAPAAAAVVDPSAARNVAVNVAVCWAVCWAV